MLQLTVTTPYILQFHKPPFPRLYSTSRIIHTSKGKMLSRASLYASLPTVGTQPD